jgi:hypothetical protein
VWKRPRVAAAIPVILFASLSAIIVRILPRPHSPLHYVVAGTMATTVALVAVFMLIIKPRVSSRSGSR